MKHEFINMLNTIENLSGESLAVACSGGADSMALTLLLAQWCAQNGSKLTAITVDHQLRPESGAEVKQVAVWLEQRGIHHVVLLWKGKKPTQNIQEEARKARYRLMTEYCHAQGIKHLLVAHHQEDQAETFLLRLARGSGVDGLAAMEPVSTQYELTIHRPLLNIPKAELISYLKVCGQDYIRDPSNENTRYDRVKMRKAMPLLAELGLSVERLAATAENMARARKCLEAETAKVMARHCMLAPEGYAVLTPFRAEPEITLRMYAALVMAIGGHEVKPRLAELLRLQQAIESPSFKGATLGGCLFIPRVKKLIVCREPKAVAPPVPAGTTMWDQRFAIETTTQRGWTTGALTQKGWLELARQHGMESTCPDKRILYSLPALRDAKGHVRAVPHLGIVGKGITYKAVFTGAQRCPNIFSEHR